MVTFQPKQQLLAVRFATAFAVHAREVALLDHRMVFVEDLRVGEDRHDFGRQNRGVGLDLAVVFLVNFTGTALRPKGLLSDA